MVVQQFKELKVQISGHLKLLTKMTIIPNTKVRVPEFKEAAEVAVEMNEKVKKLKIYAKPHMPKTSKAGSVVSVDD